jgi:nitronate monooxygenase
MITTPFTKTFGVRHPLIQAGMGGAGPDLVVAASDAGALGSLGTVGLGPGQVSTAIGEIQARTDHPFGVNILMFAWAPFAMGHIDEALRSGARIVTLSFGDPTAGLRACQDAGARTIVQVQDMERARQALDLGADMVIAQGAEAGGHSGTRGTLSFAAQVLGIAGSTPVGVAGGIADGRGVAAVLAMGASAAVVGTRFKVCHEFPSSDREKDEIIRSTGDDTYQGPETDEAIALVWPTGIFGRVVRNDFTDAWVGRREELRQRVAELGPPFGFVGELGRQGTSVNWAGESAGLVDRRQPAADVVDEIMEDAAARLGAVAGLLG